MSSSVVCADGVGRLMDYLEGVLAPLDAAAITAHVAACARCAAFVASYRETPRILRAATEVTVPVGLQGVVLDYLKRMRPGAGD